LFPVGTPIVPSHSHTFLLPRLYGEQISQVWKKNVH
jgi:hypothetical protein